VSLLLLIELFKKSNSQVQTDIYNFYLSSTKYINNWDLVDLSAPNIVGEYLYSQTNYQPLIRLTKSADLWERRIAILATFSFLKHSVKIDFIPSKSRWSNEYVFSRYLILSATSSGIGVDVMEYIMRAF
jgi:hypothetical protein